MVEKNYFKKKEHNIWFASYECVGIIMLFLFVMAFMNQHCAKAAGLYTEPGSTFITRNWAYPIKCHTIAKENGNTMVIYSVLDEWKQQTLVIDMVSSEGKRENYKKLSVLGDTWGGTVYQAPDGCNYITTGNDGDVAFYVMKYSTNWDLLGTASITKDQSYTETAFDGGNSDMTLVGNYLVLHAARGRLDGHQSNTTIWIDSRNMQPISVPKEYGTTHVSHSFSQFVRYDGNRIIMIDQGDAHPRGISMISQLPDLKNANQQKSVLMKFWILNENEDDMVTLNYTGTTVDGFELGNKHHLVVGTSIPHDTFVSGQEYDDYEGNNNVYVILIDKDLKSSKLKWLTSYPSNTYVGENLELIKIDDDQFIILYGTDKENVGESTHYMLIDSDGNIKKSGENPKPFYCTSEPSFDGNTLTWCHYVESELGHFMVMNRWNINTGNFTVQNIDIGLPSQINEISLRGNTRNYKKNEKIKLELRVFSEIFNNSFPTAPAVWESSDNSVIQVLQEENILSSSVHSSSGNEENYKFIESEFLAKKEGTATITCTIGDKKWSAKLKVIDSVVKPAKVKRLTVKKAKKRIIKLSWKKVSGVDGYQIQYATQKNFKGKKAQWVKKTRTKIKGLKKRIYYFRVRAYRWSEGKKIYGKWSSVVKKKNK